MTQFIGPEPAHHWAALFTAVVQDETETLSDGIKLWPSLRPAVGGGASEITPGCSGIEFRLTANSAGTTDDLTINHYPAADGNKTTWISTISVNPRTMDLTGGGDVIICYGMSWEDLDMSSGLVIGIVATGSTDDITVTATYRLFRIGNPVSR